MYKSFVLLFFIMSFIGCHNLDNNSVKEEYDNYKKGYKELKADKTNDLNINDLFYVELEENASVPYRWVFNKNNDNIMYLDGKSFDLYNSQKPGAAVQYIWRFKCIAIGQTDLIYKYQNIVNPTDIIETKTYSIKIN